MTWFKVDDSLADHPKVLRLQALKGWQGALALWVLAGAWASRHLTNGAVPGATVARLGASRRDADLLVSVGLWERTETGYAYHDWTSRNPTRNDVEARRERTRDRVTRWRCNAVTDVGGNPAPVPTRPVPSGDPLTTFGDSSGVRVRVEASAAEIQRRFRGLYLERFRNEPYMGGKAVHSFAERLNGTAVARGVDPLDLLGDTFKRWASEALEPIAQSAPYAAFAARFGSLLEAQGGHGLGEREQLQAAQAEAMRAGDRERLKSLVAEERRRFGGGSADTTR
jgi:hypothetical protein